MIVSIFLSFLSFLLLGIFTIFQVIDFVVPDKVEEMIDYFLSPLSYLSGIVNLPALMSVISFLISFFVAWYIVKIVIWTIGMLPFGKSVNIPKSGK